jgi:hypothetical protein
MAKRFLDDRPECKGILLVDKRRVEIKTLDAGNIMYYFINTQLSILLALCLLDELNLRI